MARRPLANVSLDRLSAGISKAVSELTGIPYSAEITQIDFESKLNSWMTDKTVLTIRLSTESSSWWMLESSSATAEAVNGRAVIDEVTPEE